uniref:Uncharacterized protein n=1 Tax=Rhizophora mucronata TaxID=61149 RepID=A0A2P2QXZ3_RHIMU
MGEYGERNIVNKEYAHLGTQLRGQNSFDVEMSENFQDSAMSLLERKGWFQKQKLQLPEQGVSVQAQALELEKQRFKWLRYCSKKDRELEQLRLENERKRVETEQSILHLRQKEVEIDLRSPGTSKDATSLGIERMPRRDQIG